MNKKILLLSVVLIGNLFIKAQDSWTYSEPGGFGTTNDQYIKCMIPFKGNLYAASGTNTGGLFSSPSGTINTWSPVLNSPLIYSFDALASTAEGGGYMFASTYSYGVDSPRVYRSFDGATWTPYYTGISDPLAHIVPFKGTGAVDSIYVIENVITGARIYRSGYLTNDPNNTSGSWQTVLDFGSVSLDTRVSSTLVNGGRFYVGTSNAQLWSTADGTTWTRNDSVAFGFNDAGNYEITALEAFGGYIYAGTLNYSGAQLWRSPDQLNWTLVRSYASSDMITDLEATGTELWIAARSANSGGGTIERTTDGSTFVLSNDNGFGNSNNHGDGARLAAFGNNMYYGTRNYGFAAVAGPGGPSVRGVGLSTGGQIWRTCLVTPPTLNIGNDTSICSSSTITLNAGAGAVSYFWNTEAITQTIQAGPGNYFCQVTGASGCDAADNITISALVSPTVTVVNPYMGLPSYVCKGDTVTMSNTAVSGLYNMDPPITKITNDTINGSLGDNFDTLAVSGVAGTCACTSLISVTIDSLEHAFMGDVVIGLYSPSGSYTDLVQFGYGGGSNAGYVGTEFRMDAPYNLLGGTPPFTGQFIPDGVFGNFLGSPNGNWILKVGDTYPSFDNGNLKGWTLKFGSADTVMTYSWTPSTGLTSTTTINSLAFPNATTTYALTVTNAIGCSTTDSILLMVPDIQMPAATAAVCYGGSTVLTATGGSNYYWSPSTSLSGTLGATVTTTATSDITYYVTDTIGGCITTDSIYVIADPQVFVTASLPQSICYADSAVLTATPAGGTPGYTYNWNDGAFNYTTQNITVTPSTATSYTLNVTDMYGCTAYDYTFVSVAPSTDLVGHVSYSGGNVTNGNVVAFRYIPAFTKFDSIQVTPLNASGDYTFTSLNSGNYLIKVFPDTIAYPALNSTYFGDEFAWDSATVFNHGCSIIDTANIVMVEETGFVGGGIGFLRGRITEDIGFGRTPGDPIPGLDVKLGKNPGGAMVASGTTNGSGYYTFTSVDFNAAGENYVVYVDIPGLGTDSSYTFVVDAASNQYLYLDYVVDSTTIHFVPNAGAGISNPAIAIENKFKVYPNPFRTNATIRFSIAEDAEVALEVYNVLGDRINTLIKDRQAAGDYAYNLNNLNAGVYFITLTVNGNSATQRVVVME